MSTGAIRPITFALATASEQTGCVFAAYGVGRRLITEDAEPGPRGSGASRERGQRGPAFLSCAAERGTASFIILRLGAVRGLC